MSLQDATTDELIKELMSRIPAGVIAITVPDDRNDTYPALHRKGAWEQQLGLTHMLLMRVEDSISNSYDPDDDGDDPGDVDHNG